MFCLRFLMARLQQKKKIALWFFLLFGCFFLWKQHPISNFHSSCGVSVSWDKLDQEHIVVRHLLLGSHCLRHGGGRQCVPDTLFVEDNFGWRLLLLSTSIHCMRWRLFLINNISYSRASPMHLVLICVTVSLHLETEKVQMLFLKVFTEGGLHRELQWDPICTKDDEN